MVYICRCFVKTSNDVVRYLGYVLRTVHDAGTGRIWLAGVQCRGTETDIGDCAHDPWGYNDCNHQQDVSIACYVSNVSHATTHPGPIAVVLDL